MAGINETIRLLVGRAYSDITEREGPALASMSASVDSASTLTGSIQPTGRPPGRTLATREAALPYLVAWTCKYTNQLLT